MAGIVGGGGDMLGVFNCRFIQQRFGVITLLANGLIKNCTFSSLPFTGYFSNIPTGTGVLAIWNSDLQIVGFGGEENSPPTFYNCATSCVSATGSNIVLAHTRTSSLGEYGVITDYMADHKAHIYNNRFETNPAVTPVYVLFLERSSNQSDQVYENHIVSNIPAGGIGAHNNYQAGAKSFVIRENILDLYGSGSIGIDLHGMKKLQLYDNAVTILSPFEGVHLFNSDGENAEVPRIIVEDLTVEALNNSGRLFHCQDTKRAQLCHNHFLNGNLGLRVRGACDESKLYFNEFNDNVLGLEFFENAIMETHEHRGNYWVGLEESQLGARHTGNNYQDSHFFVNSELTPPDPNGTYFPLRSPSNWFTSENMTPFACGDNNYHPLYDQHDLEVADGTYATLVDDPLANWQAERELYRKIMETPGMSGAHYLFEEFLESKSSQSVGILYEVGRQIEDIATPSFALADQLEQAYFAIKNARTEAATLIEQLDNDPDNLLLKMELEDKIDLIHTQRQLVSSTLDELSLIRQDLVLTAQELNQSVPATEIYEINEKAVNDILLQTVSSPDYQLSESQLETLRAIAGQCPSTGGTGVGRALTLLPGCEQWALHILQSECSNNRSRFPQKDFTDPASRLECWANPNPAGDFIRFEVHENQLISTPELTLTDMSGQVVHQQTVTDTASLINVSKWPPGVYFYRLGSSGFVPSSGKIIIMH